MSEYDKIRLLPRIVWKPVVDAPKEEIVLVLVKDGVDTYTELAWMNEYREWVDIPHLHNVIGWSEVSDILKEKLGL